MDAMTLSKARQVAIWIAEGLLMLIILGLLIAFWLPAWIGGSAGASHSP